MKELLNTLLEKYESLVVYDVSQPNIIQSYPRVIPITAVTLYLIMVFGLPKFLLKHKINCNGPVLNFVMASWNLFLSVMSACMFFGVAIPYIQKVFEYGFYYCLCDAESKLYRPSSMMFWAHYFILSKYIELVDTLLLILKNPKRSVPFLHYYHHATVLLFCWYAELCKFTAGYWFTLINAGVHMCMYFYYFLTELGYKPTWAKFLTISQILQMVIGIALAYLWYQENNKDKKCFCTHPQEVIVACSLMYGSYLLLFVHFFIKRYFIGSEKVKGE